MSSIFTKEQTPELGVVYRDVKPALVQQSNVVHCKFGGVSNFFFTPNSVLPMMATDAKIPDLNLQIRLRPALENKKLLSGVNTMTITPNALMEFNPAPDGPEINGYYSEVQIDNVESLQEVNVNVGDIPLQYFPATAMQFPEVNITYWDGATWVTIYRAYPDAVTKMCTLTSKAWWINGHAASKIRINILWGSKIPCSGPTNLAVYPFWDNKPAIILDFNNAWEDPFLIGGWGLISGLLSTIGLEMISRQMAKRLLANKEVHPVLAALGVSAAEVALNYCAALLYFTQIAKTRTLEQFTMEELMTGPIILASLLKVGSAVAFTVLRKMTGDHRGKQLSKILIDIGAGAANVATSIALVSAYLTALGTNTYYCYF